MEMINQFIDTTNTILWSYILIFLLLILGLYFTTYSKFMQFGLFKDMVRLITGKLSPLADGMKQGKNEVSAFQAFCICVASHVGTGNLAGVAIAIVTGGPGALFWMWIIALLGAATSIVENTLAQIYKVKDKNGFRGGPAYYIEKALGLKFLGTIFSIIVIVTFGLIFNSVQSNTINAAFNGAFGIDVKIGGLVIAILTAIVIFGGVTRVAKVSSVIVPIMALAYIIIALIVVAINFTHIPELFISIFENAFGIRQIAGGTLGITILQGVKRGLFSNEAGMGSAPNAAATSNVSHPVKQGLMQAFGVFVDTILICSATGFIVLLLPEYDKLNLKGIQLTQVALSNEVGEWGALFITICIFMFAFSSILGNYYYGESNIEFFTRNKLILNLFRTLVVITVYIGAVSELNFVWNLADTFMGVMAIINIIVIGILFPKAYVVIKDYIKQRKEGKNPVFNIEKFPEIKNVSEWRK